MFPYSWSRYCHNSGYNHRWTDYNGSKKVKENKAKQNGLKLRGKSLSFLNLAVPKLNQGPMFEETNEKFTRSHSKVTEKEHCIHNGKKYFKSL